MSKLSSIAHGLFIHATSKTVIVIHDAQRDKRQRSGFQRLDDPPEQLSENCSWKTTKKIGK